MIGDDFIEIFFDAVNNRDMVTIDDFKKLDIRVGTVSYAEKVQGTDKLLALRVDFMTETRQIVAGIADAYQPDDLVGKAIPVLMNIEPRKIRGIESHGMILAIDVDGKAALLHPDRAVPCGSIVR